MFVYIDTTSHVNSSALGGSVSVERIDFSAKESLKKDGLAWVMGCSWWSTHLLSPWGRLLTRSILGMWDDGRSLLVDVFYT